MAVKASAHITLNSVVDIEATYRYYLLQSSTLGKPSVPTANPPGGSWTDSEPTYDSGSTNSLYYVDLTVFSDGKYSYSPVSLSTAYEAAKEAYNKANNAQDTANSAQDTANSANDKIDNLEIGARNLIRNSINLIFGNYSFGEYDIVLPEGYTRLEYIEINADGDIEPYVDTGFKPNQDSRVVLKFMFAGGNGVYGARSTVSSRNFSMRVINGVWQLGYGDGVIGSTIASDTTNWHTVDHNKNNLYIDGQLAATRDYVTFSAPYPVAIGAIKAGSVYGGQGKYGLCKIYDNGVLVRHLVPCKDADGNAGMYDLLLKEFRGNAGTGTIVAGPEFQNG